MAYTFASTVCVGHATHALTHALALRARAPSAYAPCRVKGSGALPEPLVQVPVPSLHSHLVLQRGPDPASLPSRFAWLVGGTICHGHLLLQRYARDESVGDAAEYVGDMRQVLLGQDGAATSPEDEPTSMVSGGLGVRLLLPADCCWLGRARPCSWENALMVKLRHLRSCVRFQCPCHPHAAP